MARLLPLRPALAPAALGLCLAGCFYPGDRGRLLENKVDQLAANDTEIKRSRPLVRGKSRGEGSSPLAPVSIAARTMSVRGSGSNRGLKIVVSPTIRS